MKYSYYEKIAQEKTIIKLIKEHGPINTIEFECIVQSKTDYTYRTYNQIMNRLKHSETIKVAEEVIISNPLKTII